MIPHPINQLHHEESRRRALVARASHEARARGAASSRAVHGTRFLARGSARRFVEAVCARFSLAWRVPVMRWSARLFF